MGQSPFLYMVIFLLLIVPDMFWKSTPIEIRSIGDQQFVTNAAPHLEGAAPTYIRYRIDVCAPNLLKIGVRCFFYPTSMPTKFGLNRIKNKNFFPATSVSRVEQAASPGKGAPQRGLAARIAPSPRPYSRGWQQGAQSPGHGTCHDNFKSL